MAKNQYTGTETKYIIENNILKAVETTERALVVPKGVKQIGGCISEINESDMKRSDIIGDPIGYKAFFRNEEIEEVYLPDTVCCIGFKAFEHCKNLRVLAFSKRLRTFEANSLLGCDKLKKIIYYGTRKEFLKLEFCEQYGLTPNIIICNDGAIHNRKESFVAQHPGVRIGSGYAGNAAYLGDD